MLLEPLPGASANHVAMGRLSANLPVVALLELISEINKRDALVRGDAGPPQEEVMTGWSAGRESFAERRCSNHRYSNSGGILV